MRGKAIIAIVVFISILIKIATFYPLWIEKNYSRKVYPHIAFFFRKIFGWIPFSVGDVLYFVASVYLVIKLIKFIKIIWQRKWKQLSFKQAAVKTILIIAGVYIFFNMAWGLNYNRPGIASQLQLKQEMYKVEDLRLITSLLISKVNEKRNALGETIHYNSYRQVFKQAETACQSASDEFNFLAYRTPSVKPSMYGKLGNFLGFTGYYNPFTGEAQVNLTQPPFLVPYVSCHEISHQLGYASESEASFVGYLICMKSSDVLFHYSAYFDLFSYANRELAMRDSATARSNYRLLDTLVKRDFEELRNYWRKSDNLIEPIVSIFYDHYLKANSQIKGVKSYNEVIGWLIAYYKLYGKI